MGAKNATQKSRKSRKCCTKTKPTQTVPKRDSFQAHHQPTAPQGNGLKRPRKNTSAWSPTFPDAAVVTSNSTRTFPGQFIDLLIYLPKLSYIKYITPVIKYTHYCDDSTFWDNNIQMITYYKLKLDQIHKRVCPHCVVHSNMDLAAECKQTHVQLS